MHQHRLSRRRSARRHARWRSRPSPSCQRDRSSRSGSLRRPPSASPRLSRSGAPDGAHGSRVRAVLPAAWPGRRGVVQPGRSPCTDGRDRARVFDARTGALERTLTSGGRLRTASFSSGGSRVMTASFSPDGRRVLRGRATVRRGSGRSREDHRSCSPGIREPSRMRPSPRTVLAVTAGVDRTARVWSVESGLLVSALEHEGPVFQAEFSMDGKLVATVSRVARTGRRITRLFDAASGAPVRTFDQAGITAAVFSPDGEHIAITSIDNTTRIWNLQSLKAVAVLAQPDGDGIGAISVPTARSSRRRAQVARTSFGRRQRGSRTSRSSACSTLRRTSPSAPTGGSSPGLAATGRRRSSTATTGCGSRLVRPRRHGVIRRFRPDGRSLVTASEEDRLVSGMRGPRDLLELAGAPSDDRLNRVAISPRDARSVSR